jgi:hypothetical protein
MDEISEAEKGGVAGEISMSRWFKVRPSAPTTSFAGAKFQLFYKDKSRNVGIRR